jgi:MFS family permease
MAVVPEQETLLSRSVFLPALIAFATVFGFQLLLSVVPLYADGTGGGSSGAGLTTAAFMLSTVFAQAQMPRVLARFGYRAVLTVGLLLLGLPAFFYVAAQTLAFILAVTLLRGVGFGIATVLFIALMVELAPPGRRGRRSGCSVSPSRCPLSSVTRWGSGSWSGSITELFFYLGPLPPSSGSR